MMFLKPLEKKFFLLLIPFLLIFSSSKITRANLDDFINEKHKIEKSLNQQKLSNYLTKLLMKNDNIIDKEMFFLDNDDFNFENDDINYSSVQVKDDDNEFKARLFGLKWAMSNSKENRLRPYHVKEGNEKIENWKNYLVLMMGKENEYILKKVCFPVRQGENFGIVTDFANKCADKVDFIFLISRSLKYKTTKFLIIPTK
jgi:hypothetical protein